MDLQKCLEEEKRYRFSSFDQNDAWELGKEIVQACQEMEGPLAVEIQLQQMVVFSYYPEGTGAHHQWWLGRKRNTVNALHRSSLRVFYELGEDQDNLQKVYQLDPEEYAGCGGAFPICLKDGTQIGVAATSGLPHLRDHAALITGIARYLEKHP